MWQRLAGRCAPAAGAAGGRRPYADTRTLGDSRLLPASLENTALGEVARIFGDEFAGALLYLREQHFPNV